MRCEIKRREGGSMKTLKLLEKEVNALKWMFMSIDFDHFVQSLQLSAGDDDEYYKIINALNSLGHKIHKIKTK